MRKNGRMNMNIRTDGFSILSTILVIAVLAASTFPVRSFQSSGISRTLQSQVPYSPPASITTRQSSAPSSTLYASPNDNDRFSREVRLREEAESPFRKVRYFFYLNLAGGATTSLLISIARIAAALSGVNTDLMDESVRNALIDFARLASADSGESNRSRSVCLLQPSR